MLRRLAAGTAVSAVAGCTYYFTQCTPAVHLSAGAPPSSPPPPTPSELALIKLQTMKTNYTQLTSDQLQTELSMEEFFLTLGIDPQTPFAQKIAMMADIDQNGTITFDEYSNFAQLLDHDVLYAAFLIDTDNDGKVERKAMEQLLQHNINNASLLDSLFQGSSSMSVGSQTFVRLLHVLEDDVLAKSWGTVAVDDQITASDLLGILSDHGFVSNEKLTNSVFRFVQRQPTQTISQSQFRALFKVLRRVPQFEKLLLKRQDKKKELTKQELAAFLIQVNPNISNPAEAVDVCFGVFDTDTSNTLSLSEMRMAHDNSVLSSGGHTKKAKMSTAQSLMIGAVSGATGSCVVFPIYKVKTRLQSIPSTDTRGAFAQAREIVQKEGFFNLYRGLQAELAGIGPVKASALFANDMFRTMLKDKDGQLGAKEELMSGVGTGLIVTAFYCPQEIVTIRMQMQGMPGVIDQSMMQIVKELGPTGLYNGVGATALREVPFCVIHFSTYNWLKNNGTFIPRNEQGIPTNGGLVMCGLIAGGVAAGLDTPADTIKTRLQNGKVEYKGIVDCAVKTWQTDGARPFYSGVIPRMLMCGPKYGTIMFVKEFLQRYFFPDQENAFELDQEDVDIIRRGRVSEELRKARARYGVV